jgi:predicted amidohydrolase
MITNDKLKRLEMIEKDLKTYLDKIDNYINISIELIEQASRIYGQYIDDSGSNSEFNKKLKELSDEFKKTYFEITDYTIDDLAPDPFQDLDTSAHTFILTCDNCITFLNQLTEESKGNYWLIKKTLDDCQKDYKKLLNNRRNQHICSLSTCGLPIVLKIDPDSRILLSVYQRLEDSQITCIDLWLSGEISSIQINIELETTDIEKQDILNLALRCLKAIREDLMSLSLVKVIFISFRTSNRLHPGWIRGNKDDILSHISQEVLPDEFEKLFFICYLGDVLVAAQKLDDLAEHSSFSIRDFEAKEILIETAGHLEVLVKKAASDLDPLTDLTMKWSFQHALLSCMQILLKVISATKDQDVANRFIHFFGMFRRPDNVEALQDYSKLFSGICEIIEFLKLRYIVIPNLRKISLGMKINKSPRIAIVQPKICIETDYKDFQLTEDGSKNHLNIFTDYVDKAKQQSVNAIVFPEMFFPASQIQYLKDKSKDSNLIIITGLDYEYDGFGKPINSCAISLPDGNIIKQRKLYASKYDSPSMIRGEDVSVFSESAIGNFSIFICFDYLSSQDLIKLRGVTEILFVLALNPDIRAYHEKAKADAYSYLYGFVVVVNAFDPTNLPPIQGGSGFYGPIKKNRIINRFEERKYGMMIAELPLEDLCKARRGDKISALKSLPANFENLELAKDYPEKEITDIRDFVLRKIKESKRNASLVQKTDYESLIRNNISQNLEEDIQKKGYAIMEIEPVHHGIATRMKASLLINKGLSRKEIKTIITKAIQDVRTRQCFSNEIQESRHKGKLADVVWLDVFNERRHKRYLGACDYYPYYVCTTQWISPRLDRRFCPMPLKGDDEIGDIKIQWSKNYQK